MAFCFSKAQCSPDSVIPPENKQLRHQVGPEGPCQMRMELKLSGDKGGQWSGFPPGNWLVEVVRSKL